MEAVRRRYPEINGSTLKLIALFSMLTDHTAAVLFPYLMMKNDIFQLGFSMEYMAQAWQQGGAGWLYIAYQVMRRLIGRLAFPIYCFLLVEGFERTRSRPRYALRLFVFALISEIPFNLAFCGRAFDASWQNVFVTLFLGVLMMWAMRALEEHFFQKHLLLWGGVFLVFGAAALLAEALRCDYGAHGIIAVALLYLFRKNKGEQIIAGAVAFLWEVTAPLAFIFVGFYNGKRGLKLKYIFYIFYPAHLLLLYGVLVSML